MTRRWTRCTWAMASSASATVPKVVVPTNRGPAQPAQRVLLVIGVLRHARHGERVQRLQQSALDTADEHGGRSPCTLRAMPSGGGRPRRDPLAIAGRSSRCRWRAGRAGQVTRAGAARPADQAQGSGRHGPPRAARPLDRIEGRHGELGSVAKCPCASSSWGPVPSAASGAVCSRRGYDVTLVARGAHARGLASGLVLEAPTRPSPCRFRSSPTRPCVGLDRRHRGAARHEGPAHRPGARAARAVAPPGTPSSACRTGWRTSAGCCAASPYLRHVRHVPGHPAATGRRPGALGPRQRAARPGRYPAGVGRRGQAIAAALATDLRVGRPARHHALEIPQAPDEPRQHGRGAVRARGRCSALAREAQQEGKAVLEAAGIDVATAEEPRPPRRPPAVAPTTSGEWRGGSTWQSLARPPGRSRPNSSTARSCCWARSTACPPRSTACCSASRSRPPPKGPTREHGASRSSASWRGSAAYGGRRRAVSRRAVPCALRRPGRAGPLGVSTCSWCTLPLNGAGGV